MRLMDFYSASRAIDDRYDRERTKIENRHADNKRRLREHIERLNHLTVYHTLSAQAFYLEPPK